MELLSTTLIILLFVSLSGVFIRLLPFQLPLPLMQILFGVILAALGFYMELDPEVFLVLFIPPLLFADGRETVLKDFIYNIREIVGLALALVVVTIILLGYVLYWILPNVSLPAAFALAAVLSPTDAVALSGIVEKGLIDKNKMEIIEGEALMNDASGLVSLKFAILIAVGQMEFNLFQISLAFFFVAIAGLATGVGVTWAYAKILRKIDTLTNDDSATQIVLLFLLPFAAYLTAEHLGFSGILAAVSAGMTVNQSGLMHHAPLATRLQSNSTWSMLTFVFNGFVFTLLGIQLPRILTNTYIENKTDKSIEVWELALIVLLVYTLLMVMRFTWLSVIKYVPPFLTKRPLAFATYSTRDRLISTLAGVRGSITLAGVLSIPIGISGRYELVFISAGVILVSLIVAVFMLPILLKNSVMMEKTITIELLYAKSIMAEGAIEKLEKMRESLKQDTASGIDNDIINEVSIRIIRSLRHRTGLKDLDKTSLDSENLERRMRLIAIGAERALLYQLKADNKISNSVLNRLTTDLDLYEIMLAQDH